MPSASHPHISDFNQPSSYLLRRNGSYRRMQQSTNTMAYIKILIAAALVSTASSHPFHLSNTVSAIDNFYKHNRFKGAFLTCAIKGCSADLVAQYITSARKGDTDGSELSSNSKHGASSNLLVRKMSASYKNTKVSITEEEEKFTFDFRRSAVFLLYGGFYQGMANEVIYNDLLPKMFGTGTDFKTVASKVLVDNVLHTPLLNVPVVYLIKGWLLGHSVRDSLRNYWDDVVHKGLLYKKMMIFVPVQCLTFSVIPPHFRVTFVAFVSFFWMILLSCILSDDWENIMRVGLCSCSSSMQYAHCGWKIVLKCNPKMCGAALKIC